MAKASNKPTKVKPDWEAIQREYRAGVLSVREIGRMHSVDHALIIRRAKKFPEQWQRDLTKRVREAVARKIAISNVTKTVDDVTTAGDEESIVEKASDRDIKLILSHQRGIAGLTKIEAALAVELNDLTGTKKKTSKDVKPIALSTKVTTYLALVSASEKRIRLERQAFGLKDDSRPAEDPITGIFIEPISAGGNHG